MRPHGHNLRQITHLAGDATNVDWSPDGRRLVFSYGTDTSVRIAIIGPDGTGLKVLPQPSGVLDDQPSFTPDGGFIFFERGIRATNEDSIWRMTSDGRDQTRILNPFPRGFVTDPNVSPNGKTLSFQGWDGVTVGPAPDLEPARGLFTAKLDGSHISQIRPFTADESIKVDWAPSGRRIAATENANFFHPAGSANIVTMRADGSDVRLVTHFDDPTVNAFFGSYSPSGRWLVFRLESHGLFTLYRIRPDGSHRQVILTPSSFRPFLIDWGPEGDDD